MRFSRVLAVDCGASRVLGGRFTRDAGGGLMLERYAIERLSRREPTEEAWLAETGAALQALVRRESWSGPCILGLPGHLTFSKIVGIPPVSARQRRKIVGFEVRQGIPPPLAEMVWTEAPVAESADGQEVVLTAVKRSVIEALCAQLRQAGLYPVAALPAWLVLQQGMTYNHPDSEKALAVAIGARSAQLVYCGAAGSCIRTLALGGDTITQKIAGELGMDFSQAESLKLEVMDGVFAGAADTPEHSAVQLATDEFVRRLGGEISRSLARFDSENGGGRPALLYLSGGGALIDELPARLTESLRMPVVCRDPWQRLKPGGVFCDCPGKIEPALLADLVGLAAAGRAPAAVNLLPHRLRREMFLRRRWPWLAAAVVLLAFGQAAAIMRERTATGEWRRRAADVQATIDTLRGLDLRNRRNLARQAESNRRLAALQRVAEAKRGWLVFLSDLQDRLAKTGDAWLERLQVMPAAGSDAGSAAGVADRNAPLPAIRISLAGCLFDPENPTIPAGEGSYRRAKTLLARLSESPFVSAVEDERFDGGQPGMLRFELTLVLVPGKLL